MGRHAQIGDRRNETGEIGGEKKAGKVKKEMITLDAKRKEAKKDEEKRE